MKLFSLLNAGKIHTSNATKIIPSEEFSTLLSAHEILQKAEEEKAKLLAETAIECQSLKEQAEAQGFQKGLELFNEQLLGFEENLKALRHDVQKEMLPLVLRACKKIVGEELKMHPDTIVQIIQQAIKPIIEHRQVKIYVSKEELEIALANKQELKNRFDKLESFSIETKKDLSPGSCMIETEVGIINATLENQLRALEAAFENFMRKHHV